MVGEWREGDFDGASAGADGRCQCCGDDKEREEGEERKRIHIF